MHDHQDRRSFIERLAAGIGVAGFAAAAVTGDADAKKRRKKSTVYSFTGDFSAPVYTPDPKRGDPYYIITFRQRKDLTMTRSGRNGKRKISGHDVYDLMMGMSRKGDLKGKPAFRIEGISWRLHRSEFNDATGEWTLHASVCSTNPDARPKAGATRDASGDADAQWYYGMKGDGCGCSACDSCYICGADNSHHCSDAIEYHCL